MPDQNRTEKLLTDLIEKIEILIKLTSIQVGADTSVTERARLLKIAGLDNQTIAEVLNISSAVVRALTSNRRTARR